MQWQSYVIRIMDAQMERSKKLPGKEAREASTDTGAQFPQEIWKDPIRHSSKDIYAVGYK